jgi:hypothetical protein
MKPKEHIWQRKQKELAKQLVSLQRLKHEKQKELLEKLADLKKLLLASS